MSGPTKIPLRLLTKQWDGLLGQGLTVPSQETVIDHQPSWSKWVGNGMPDLWVDLGPSLQPNHTDGVILSGQPILWGMV